MKRSEFIKKTMLGLTASFLLPRIVQAQTPEMSGEHLPSTLPHFVTAGNGFGNRIAITFDDGPNPGITEVVLEELAKRNLRATFFMIGRNVKAYPSLAKEVADAGHEVANHSYTHSAFNKMSDEKVMDELQMTQDVIAEATGKTPKWFRPPYGAFRKNQGHMPLSKGLGIVYWSVDPQDWAQPGASVITSRVLGQTGPGSIILLHDLHQQTAQAVGNILDGLQEKSYNFTNMTHFVGEPYV